MPETPARLPINTKRGTTDNSKKDTISKASPLKLVSAGVVPFITHVPTNPTTSIAIATGMRSTRNMKRKASPMMPIVVGDIYKTLVSIRRDTLCYGLLIEAQFRPKSLANKEVAISGCE